MNKLTTLVAAIGLLSVGTAGASDMYIDLGTNAYEVSPPNTADANSTTGIFNEFGFSQMLATSIYDFSDGSIFGAFYDTNIPSELTAAGIPTSGIALDGTTLVNLDMPNCAAGQCDIDALSPLVPPLGSDSEGFLLTWDLQVAYHFDGILTGAGPVYTGGSFDIYFNDLVDDTNDRLVLTGALTGSTINAANLDLFFDITFAEDGWLYIENSSGIFVDAQDVIAAGGGLPTMHLDTNVNPPIPTADQLLLVFDDQKNPNVIRQTTLDGSLTAAIPSPTSLAIFGLGLVALGLTARRRRMS